MEVELLEIRDHMRQFPPFDTLPEDWLDRIAHETEIAYYKAGSEILGFDQPIHHLCYIRSGAVEIQRRNGDLYNRLTEGELFGHFGLLRNGRVRFPAVAFEDSLIYFIPETLFNALCEADEHFADFVEVESHARLKTAIRHQTGNQEMITTRVRKLLGRDPVMVPVTASIQEAARRMTDESVSSLLIYDPEEEVEEHRAPPRFEGEYHRILGILTDRDLRTRVLAEGLPPDTPLQQILSEQLVTVRADTTVMEAMLTMLRHNVHHLPVLKGRRTAGVLSLSDLIKYESRSSFTLVNSIYHQQSLDELKLLANEVSATFVSMVQNEANSHMIGSAMAVIGRSFAQRLLELGEARLGPPPVPYSFMALGSQARDDQTLVTDQDNAMVLDDRYDPERHGEYFSELAQFVCDGLDACGYDHCAGGIMASNPSWRQPLSAWQETFSRWIGEPTPETLLHSNIFFDLDNVYGDSRLVQRLKEQVAGAAGENPRFLASMARNALGRTPPLGFFRTFVVEVDGEENRVINLKSRGTAPLVDLIRVHALACGSLAQNPFERLDDIAAASLLPEGSTERLRYALEFISMVRIRHQAAAVEEGRRPSNKVSPEHLSAEERRNLKDAFQVLSSAQRFLRFRYSTPARPPARSGV